MAWVTTRISRVGQPRKALPSMSNVVSWGYLIGRGWVANHDSMHGKSDSTEKNADLRDWYRPETCLQILGSAGAVSLKPSDIKLHAWRNLFWTGTEKRRVLLIFLLWPQRPQFCLNLQVRPHWLCRAHQVLLSWTWSQAEKPAPKPPHSLRCCQKLKVELNDPEWNFFSTPCTLITKTRHMGYVGHTVSLHRHARRWREWHYGGGWISPVTWGYLSPFHHVGNQCLATATSVLLFSKPVASGSLMEVTFWAFQGLRKSILAMWRTLHDGVIKIVFCQWRRQEGKEAVINGQV